MAIIDAWVDPNRHHVPGCPLDTPDFQAYCLDCHADAYNALAVMKQRRGET